MFSRVSGVLYRINNKFHKQKHDQKHYKHYIFISTKEVSINLCNNKIVVISFILSVLPIILDNITTHNQNPDTNIIIHLSLYGEFFYFNY